MDHVVIASAEADARAVEAVREHHTEMAGALAAHVGALVTAAATGADADEPRARLVDWCERHLVPHALAEEQAMYPAAHDKPEGRLLVEGMLAEHRTITNLVATLRRTSEPVQAAASGFALQTAFESHLAKENDLVLPLLAGAGDVSVARLLAGMHDLLGEDEPHDESAEPGRPASPAGHGHGCACGEVDEAVPVLDARVVPHAIRHATIFGALEAVRPGGGIVLLAPHDPKPLLAQVEQRAPGRFAVSYLEEGPETWRLSFVRRPVA